MDCLFCDIINRKQDAYVIFEDDTHIAIMDKYPIQKGHSLVMPKAHHEKITDMDGDDVGKLFSNIPIIARGITAVTGADGFNIGQNNGRSANQIIPHVHVHIIPRYGHIGNSWAKRMITNDNDLGELAKKIRNNIKSC
ncbi:HIT family protein [Candidatus Nitrosotalea okcheonensis]|uniref:Histidine triad (HIT) protein n=1 Tax=Candidatus Nitrosotalea okcheonensis TaxID=1903276 RepID=A0A2H1FD75_9ARCH|nr:HIT family protein [Candidatus Nitrosotalea okcheonensis]MDE1728756.1 HIT family protein [Nitrososphaerota archaeon]MDE1831453.1 HIT family protein [Nitrososphaerota archaeon]MDE1877362.1 HIT family protein [Nitrososphaerota archaeon]SMH70701.1 Histidine triad (HIT) protein [Candidatus Nitrosotalea okcheonensis]